MELTWASVCARRLRRHGLSEPAAPAHLARQVGAICGAHAQVMAAAELSIGLRVTGATRTTVRDALWTERSLVKTYGPRGTVHLLPSVDLPYWTAALSAAPAPYGGFPASIRMSDDQTDSVVAAIGDALSSSEMTIDELSNAVISRVGPWAGELVMPAFNGYWPRWRQAMTTAAHRGVLCFGPNRGRNVTYTSPRRQVPDWKPVASQEALTWLVRSYLFAYGPAMPQQFAQWLGATKSWATDLFDSLASDGAVEPVTFDGLPGWVAAGDTGMPDESPGGVQLLPYFDAYGVGCHPRERVFPGVARERALANGQAGTLPVMLVDGVVAGVWHSRRSGKSLAITVEPFRELTISQRDELDAQVARAGEVLEARPAVTIGEVTVGSHL